ncbi:hypothetical protein J2Z32_003563 [Paenibacillus turicensis]|uniref:Uncharacterized protein n=1 Tax=Paenibacillus turicensis TaxID=160487 RepID=A0ABS4FX33_9BACL|nr:hypothetical protein [Paenibacillus turicensis]
MKRVWEMVCLNLKAEAQEVGISGKTPLSEYERLSLI